MPLGNEIKNQKVFTAKRKRAFVSFRRKNDAVWAVVSVVIFSSGGTGLWFGYRMSKPTSVTPAVDVVSPLSSPSPILPRKESPLPSVTEEPVKETPPVSPPPPVVVSALPKQKNSSGAPVRGGDGFRLSSSAIFKTESDAGAKVSVKTLSEGGETAVRLNYSLGSGTWVLCYFDMKEDFSLFSRVRFVFKGQGASNSLEFKWVDSDGTNMGDVWLGRTGQSSPTVVDVKLKQLTFLGGTDSQMDWGRVRRLYFAVSKRKNDKGGTGTVTIRGLKVSP